MAAKRQRKEKARENRTKEGLRTRVRISGETESSWLAQLTYSRLGEGREKNIKRRSQNGSPLFFRVGPSSDLKDIFSFACQIKLSCNQAVILG